MVQLIVGEKGKGKTKQLLDKANNEIVNATGNIVYLDKTTKNMYELNNKIRLICVPDYMIENGNEFVGFLCGILSQDHDLQTMYLDNFLKISNCEVADLTTVIDKIDKIGDHFNVNFVCSISIAEAELPENAKDKVLLSL